MQVPAKVKPRRSGVFSNRTYVAVRQRDDRHGRHRWLALQACGGARLERPDRASNARHSSARGLRSCAKTRSEHSGPFSTSTAPLSNSPAPGSFRPPSMPTMVGIRGAHYITAHLKDMGNL